VRLFLFGLVLLIVGLCGYCWVCAPMMWYMALVVNAIFVLGSLIIARYVVYVVVVRGLCERAQKKH